MARAAFENTKKKLDFLTLALAPTPVVPYPTIRTRACAHDAAAACSRMPRRKNPCLRPQRVSPDTPASETLRMEPQRTLREPQPTRKVSIKTNSPCAPSDLEVPECPVGTTGRLLPRTRSWSVLSISFLYRARRLQCRV